MSPSWGWPADDPRRENAASPPTTRAGPGGGVLDSHLDSASRAEASYADLLGDLLAVEASARRERYLVARIRRAHLPFRRTLEEFDFTFQPSIDQRQIKELATLSFVTEAANVIISTTCRDKKGNARSLRFELYCGSPGKNEPTCPCRCCPRSARKASPHWLTALPRNGPQTTSICRIEEGRARQAGLPG